MTHSAGKDSDNTGLQHCGRRLRQARHRSGQAGKSQALIYHQEETGATTEYSFHQLKKLEQPVGRRSQVPGHRKRGPHRHRAAARARKPH